ncbi:Uracil-DNA glycosylase [Leucoagaricus sp. SymC.cos]|nr:Uracil-DNA glycosylase [Leucoagaricus sp. SymC.cos]
MSSPAEETTHTVFLEDIDSNYKARRPEDDEQNASQSSQSVPGSSQEQKKPSNKRQRTIEDMFFGGKKATGSSKKAKVLAEGGTNSASGSQKIVAPALKMSGVQKLNAIPFSLSEFVSSLNEEEKRLLHLECEAMGKSWLKLLKDEIQSSYFLSLKRFLWEEGVRGPNDTPKSCKIYPPAKDIYAWSKTPVGKIKVVIIGQDPYHGSRQAHGLCFSVPPGVPIPPSLRNASTIYQELKLEYPDFEIPKHGNLDAWASNGVLLLNTCLTVRAGDAGSHSGKGWEQFTEKVVEVVDRYGGANISGWKQDSEANGIGRGVVFLAWGNWAAKRVQKLDHKKHLILKSAHPSPLSANRGFIGNGHFKEANKWLEEKYGADGRVDWCNLRLAA